MADKKNYTDREFVKRYEKIVPLDSVFNMAMGTFFSFLFIFMTMGLAFSYFSQNNGYVFVLLSVVLEFIFVGVWLYKRYRTRKKKFQEEFGMEETAATKRYESIKNNPMRIYYLPLANRICMFNPDARASQVEQIRGWYTLDDYENLLKETAVNMILDSHCTDTEDISSWKSLLSDPIFSRYAFMDKLFKLTILEDGIHNDEWEMLMNWMIKLKLNKNYIAYFKKRYDPLRTEFDECDPRNAASSREIPVSMKNPYYRVLGLDEDASDEEVKRAYHDLALQHHPDLSKNADRVEECEALMAKINEAYEKVRG